MDQLISFAKYSPVGDLTVLSVCFVMLILLFNSYVIKSRSFRVFLSLIVQLMMAAIVDVTFYTLVSWGYGDNRLVFGLRCAYHSLLFLIFLHFVIYIAEVTRLQRREKAPYIALAGLIFAVVVSIDVWDTVRGSSFTLTDNGLRYAGRDIFFIGYAAFVALIVAMLARVGKRLYKRVMMGFYGTMAVSFLILLLQGLGEQSSFTVATFMYPILAMLYIMHSNPYDAKLGTTDSRALEEMVRYNYLKGRDFEIISLYLRYFDEEGKKLPSNLQDTIRRFATDFFRGAALFRVDRGHIVLLAPKDRNPDYEQRITSFLTSFRTEYHRYKYDYKLIVGHSIDEVSRKNEYVSFLRSIYRDMEENSIHWIEPKDVKRFNSSEYILRQLEDISAKGDLNDPRVLAYCQPVYNICTGKYDTGEALMRLQLEDVGLVFPDQFIPLAEENGYIHVLTEIILNKTCAQIARLSRMGCDVCRISVNVSALELGDNGFCDDVTRIIHDSGIEGDKIAIELTESQSDSDFLLMKDKIDELRSQGIKFYLDDFGTGYSNMERIMELPFDIIKFDRSLVLASESSERSRKIVVGLAHMFSDLDYSVLYEGVEKDSDEKMCMDMDASYLQGYKYSRPVPIEEMEHFFAK